MQRRTFPHIIEIQIESRCHRGQGESFSNPMAISIPIKHETGSFYPASVN